MENGNPKRMRVSHLQPEGSSPGAVIRNLWSLYFLLLVSSMKVRHSWIQYKTWVKNIFIPEDLVNKSEMYFDSSS